MDKTVEEAREAKSEVEEVITRLLRNFELTYAVSVKDVRVEILRPFGSRPSVGLVKLDVEI